MIPKKRILLAASNELRASELRYLLNVRGFAVISGAGEARVPISYRSFNLVLIDWPHPQSEGLIDQAHDAEIPSVVVSCHLTQIPESCLADIFVSKCAEQSLDLVECIKVASARKRGPKPMKKPVASVEVNAAAQEVCA